MERIFLVLTVVWLSAVGGRAQQNGELWPDVGGKHINAHGGNIIRYGETYYWYGENRPYRGFTTEVGVEVYSSKDLRAWTDEGVALAVSEEAGSDIERGCIMERPKVLYNAKTGKFVMLFHLELKGCGYEAARVAFAVSDTPTGPFRFVRSTRINANVWPFDYTAKQQKAAMKTDASKWEKWWTPQWMGETQKGMYLWRDMKGGQMSRDMTVYVDDDGRAYHITSSQENLTLLVSELTDDYLDFTGKYNQIAPGGQNEAPCIFKRNGVYWLICSGCTGWEPNEARMFRSESIWGPWTQLPSPFVGEGGYHGFAANKTFGAQGTYIFRKNEEAGTPYVFMADIWNPRHLSESLHLWLPIGFEADGRPVIRWQQQVPD
ncbi:MAG: family 43 glycosylhydrolase [Bacteroidaceae bacterium]|nr:family 43 glycosylhydrolase [Bacteroidaceae bacterium]